MLHILIQWILCIYSNLLISFVTNNKSMQLYVAGLPTMNVVHLKPIHVTILDNDTKKM